jgi:pSer/pThr/pTyr-binding forkhead associated (FHA) protein
MGVRREGREAAIQFLYQRDLGGFTRRFFREFFARMPVGAVLVFDNFQDARVTLEPSGALRISDAKSTNGTFVDGRQLGDGESVVLRAGAELRLGDVALRVHDTKTLLDVASRFQVSAG